VSKPRLSKSAIQLREQIDDSFPDRDRASDGWIGDSKHSARKSDHNPDAQGWVRAIDIDSDLNKSKGTSVYLADQIRECAKSDRRITYIIHMGKICSRKSLWRWVKYTGFNKHTAHIHVSFAKSADQDSKFFNIPMLGGSNG
jgi:hypothetical protein